MSSTFNNMILGKNYKINVPYLQNPTAFTFINSSCVCVCCTSYPIVMCIVHIYAFTSAVKSCKQVQ